MFDSAGQVDMRAVDTVAGLVGVAMDRLVWEAPLKHQQMALIDRFGLNVNLGNIAPSQVLAVEALRSGLRYETLRSVTAQMAEGGELDLERPEPDRQ